MEGRSELQTDRRVIWRTKSSQCRIELNPCALFRPNDLKNARCFRRWRISDYQRAIEHSEVALRNGKERGECGALLPRFLPIVPSVWLTATVSLPLPPVRAHLLQTAVVVDAQPGLALFNVFAPLHEEFYTCCHVKNVRFALAPGTHFQRDFCQWQSLNVHDVSTVVMRHKGSRG